ncbi:hypothetical protein E3P92_00429 [Wallemia ichthyophaga]|uniref:Coatomer subunit epsilon n=1 Tax=Wallemia ichthyophaga TaxID=245174 RepID=A0A4T0HFJ1_WALIC|nr:hypothetical protein E3P91_01525 [Wallemia ichthyophaga]TIA82132.1 hypothetical protein E3P98_01534 [Wallemia ichthyophaga]TIB03461.1 hypothetical protein E3P95_00638 [Wallemia ichthyophaga]TIB04182.1 hypothetical protein E3P94_00635 [Wallemia ichthyophaga]TIB13242.1 hypothetical protein E3P90_01672 [Wallemia ichthyophaga]
MEDIKQFYFEGSHEQVIDSVDSSALDTLQDRINLIYSVRSHIALQKTLPYIHPEAIESHIELRVLDAYTNYITAKEQTESLDILRDCLIELESEEHPFKGLLSVLAASVFWQGGEIEEALSTLGAGQGVKDVECVALLIQIYITMNRLDLAKNEYQHARTWADDNYLIQLSEAWLGLAGASTSANIGYEHAYYILEELPDREKPYNKLLRAIAHAALSHFDEAQVELDTLSLDDENTLTNTIVISTHLNKDTKTLIDKLRSINSNNPLIKGLDAKSNEFDSLSKQFM